MFGVVLAAAATRSAERESDDGPQWPNITAEEPQWPNLRVEDINPVFGLIGGVARAEWGAFGEDGPMDAAPFAPRVANFYMTDPISRASETMAQCTRVFGAAARTGTDG